MKRKEPPSDSDSSEGEGDKAAGGGDEEVMRGVKRMKIEVDDAMGSVSEKRSRHQLQEEVGSAATSDEEDEENAEGEDGASTIRGKVKHTDKGEARDDRSESGSPSRSLAYYSRHTSSGSSKGGEEDESDDDDRIDQTRDGHGHRHPFDVESDMESDSTALPVPPPSRKKKRNGSEVVAETYPARAALDRGREPGSNSEYRSTTPMSPVPGRMRTRRTSLSRVPNASDAEANVNAVSNGILPAKKRKGGRERRREDGLSGNDFRFFFYSVYLISMCGCPLHSDFFFVLFSYLTDGFPVCTSRHRDGSRSR
jgi:hypothetical protein